MSKKSIERAQTEHNKKAILKALENTLGVVQPACKITGVSRTQFYHWLKTDAEFKSEVEDIRNIALDFAESQLHGQMKDGNVSAIIFYLKTQGKNRGYVERQEITGAEGNDIEINVNVLRRNAD